MEKAEGGRKVMVHRKRKHEEEDGSYLLLLASTSHRKLASRGGKRVVKEQETSSDEGHVRVNKNATYYRSNLKSSIKELKALCFNDTHLREIERTPFWLMFDAIYRMGDAQLKKRCQKNEDVIRQIMLAFDHLSESFMIAGQQIPLSNRDAQLIFGISGGSETIQLKLTKYEIPSWIHRCFGQEISASNGPYVLYKNYIFQKLKQMLSRNDITSVRDVARLTHCYLMAAVLSPNQNASIAWHLTTYLEKFDEIGHYDWCKFIVEMLRSQIISSKSLRAGGCAILLPFWLCEHTHLIQPKNELAFPRFLKWDLNDLSKKLSRVELSKLDRECISKLVLKPTTMEKDKFRTLITYCDFEVERQRNHPILSDDEEIGNDRVDGELSIFGDEDAVELRTRGDLNTIRKDLLSKKDRHEDIPSTSKKKSTNHVIQTQSIYGQNIQSSTKCLETDDMSSFSLNLSQMTMPPPNVNDVIAHVIDDLIASGGDFATAGKRVVKEQETSSDEDTSTPDYTSEGQERKVKKPTNCFGHVRVNKNATYYRSNLKTSIKELMALCFNDTHLREIERTPFWLMFDAIYRMGDAQLKKRCQKNEDSIRQIMLAFDHLSESFMIAGQQIPLCNRDVQLIFGISGGSETIPLKLTKYEIPPWIHRCFGQEISASNGPYVLYKNYIFQKLEQMLSRNDITSVRDVARLTHCYLMAAVLSPNQNASISWHLTTYLEKFDEIGRYDWCKFIVEMLRSQIISSKSLRAGGCAILLPFWLCEHTHLIQPKNELAFPRFLKWDLNDLSKELSRVELSKLDRECISKLVLKPTTMEKDKFRTLITYCDFEVERQRNHSILSDDEEIGNDRVDGELSIFGDEDTAELGTRGDLNTIRKDLLSKKDIHEDIPSTSKKKSTNHVIQTQSIFGQNIQSNTKCLETDDMSSFSLNLSQMTMPPPNVNDVIAHVIDDLIASGGDFATAGTEVTDDVEIEAGLGKSNEVINSGVPKQVGQSVPLGLEKESGGERSNLIKELVMNKFGNSRSKLKAGVSNFISGLISHNERLSSEVEHLHRERQLGRASFEAELKKKEDCIAKLRAENDDLRTRLKKICVYTSDAEIGLSVRRSPTDPIS
ncbi:hypothetical protein ACS0TY_005903 [Phlomoides rotata]